MDVCSGGVELLLLQYKSVSKEWGFTIVAYRFYQTKKRETENIGMKLNIAAISLLLLLASVAEVSGDTYFDVTKYGAQADGKTDISQVKDDEIIMR